MAKISVYINEKASGLDKKSFEKDLKKYFFRHDIKSIETKSLSHLKNELSKDLKNNTEYIFAIGGDGTANIISQYLAFSEIKLMVIPLGTANDFAHELGTSRNTKQIVKIFQSQNYKSVDLIQINKRFMLSSGGIGIAGNVAAKVNELRIRFSSFKNLMSKIGSSTYALMLVKELLKKDFSTFKFDLKSKNTTNLKNTSSPLILINNQSMIGGKFQIAPDTRNDDGTFNVLVFLHDNKLSFAKTVVKMLLKQDIRSDKNLISFETKALTVELKNGYKLPFFGDGEIFETHQKYDIKLIQSALKVCFYDKEKSNQHGYSLNSVRLT